MFHESSGNLKAPDSADEVQAESVSARAVALDLHSLDSPSLVVIRLLASEMDCELVCVV